MEVYGLEKLSLVDYSNYACAVIFTGGCNFRCPFCHNSGLVDKEVNPISNLEVLEFLEKRRKLLDAVCISGGEPTLQSDLIDFIKKVKNLGYKVKLDTNGTNPTMLKEIINNNLVDYIAMDIKNSFDKYPLTTGLNCIDLNNIKLSIDLIKESQIDYEFRTTLVKEFHEEKDIMKISDMLGECKRLYLQKFVSNENCINSNLNPIDKDTAENWRQILSQNIDHVYLRGYV